LKEGGNSKSCAVVTGDEAGKGFALHLDPDGPEQKTTNVTKATSHWKYE
jgi:hypothetical protein